MIRVSVELLPSDGGPREELAEMFIWNDGTEPSLQRGNYGAITLDMRTKKAKRSTTTQGYPRLSKDIWYLITDCLEGMDYGRSC